MRGWKLSSFGRGVVIEFRVLGFGVLVQPEYMAPEVLRNEPSDEK